MARLGRVVAAGFPHHVTQRGNRRQTIFFEPADYALYRDLLAERCRKASVEVWAYCLMPNHAHLVLTPATPGGLARAIGETHRQYTGFANARARWTGHLFQGRFSSAALDDAHLVAAAHYVALNPVRARLVARAGLGDGSTGFAMPGMTGKRSAINKASPRFRNFGSRYRVGSLDFRGGPARYWRMQIEFTPEQREFVRRAVESGRYERPEDAVQAAMTLWVERERRRAEILAAVDIAKASIDRGDGIEITRESMRALAEDVKRRGRAQLAAEQPAAR